MKIFGDYKKNEYDNLFFDELENKLKDVNKDICIYLGYPIIEMDNSKNFLKSVLICNSGIYVYYETNEEKKTYKRFITKVIMDSSDIFDLYEENSNIIIYYTRDQFEQIVNKIENSTCVFSEKNLSELNAIIQKSFGLTKKDERQISNPNSLGNLIKQRNNKLCMFDESQFNMVYEDTNTHLRVRGLAGSGKTILLVKKMAYLHYLHPELKMAYVFYTVSLKQFIQNLFMRFYRDFDKVNDPNFDNIHILHSWGSLKADGFYSSLCKTFNIEKKTIADVISQTNKFGYVCDDLLKEMKKINNTGVYDKIFIDEAQDFPLEFFRLAKSVLTPTGTIIYAYDELQSLNDSDMSMPTKKEIFGDEPCNDVNLKICYRTPNQILITAHALGLGVYNIENGKTKWANMIQDLSTWESIGYEVESGQLDYGKDVTLVRRKQNFEQFENPIEFSIYNNDIEQYENVCNEIFKLITTEDIKPEDILIIDLNSISVNDDYLLFKNEFYKLFEFQESINDYLANVNIVNRDNAIKFRIPNSIPFTTIFRAKGNEANIVFILNAHKMNNIYSFARNRIFTAMTRSKFKVYISGNDAIQKYIDEYELVKQNNFKLSFKYPTKTELNNLKTIARKESKTATSFAKVLENFKELRDNPELIKELLLSQTGQSDVEGLIGFIENLFGEKTDE